MKTLGLLLLLTLPVFADDTADFAQTSAVDRYQPIWERSPFIVEAPPAQESSPLAQRFAITAVTMLGDQPMVFVLDRKTLQRISLTTQPSPDGFALVSLVTNADPKQVRANIRVGREQASIGYDLGALQSLDQSTAAAPAASPAGAAAPYTAAPAMEPQVSSSPLPDQSNPKPPAVRIIRRATINLGR